MREIAVNHQEEFHWQATALNVIQMTVEQILVMLFECKITIFSNKLSTNKKQMILIL